VPCYAASIRTARDACRMPPQILPADAHMTGLRQPPGVEGTPSHPSLPEGAGEAAMLFPATSYP
jgi:hypothetical protein